MIEVSNDNGANWQPVEQVGGGTPLAWIEVEFPLLGLISPMTDQMRFRFTAADLGSGSLVEAGIDEFRIVDRDQGCLDCPLPLQEVGTIRLELSGNDVVLDWTDDPVPGSRFAVYRLSGPGRLEIMAGARDAGLDHRIPDALAGVALGLDLIDQDHRVLGDHADQRQDAQDGDEAERLAGDQQRADHADQPQRYQAQDHEQAREALELEDQQAEHDQQHDGHHREHRGL